VNDAELRDLVEDGKVRPSDFVWRQGMPDWLLVSKVEGLFAEGLPRLSRPTGHPSPDGEPRTVVRRSRGARGDVAGRQVWLFSIATLGFFGFYLVPSWAEQLERITGKPRMSFGTLLGLGIVTLGVALLVVEIVYAFKLTRHGQRAGRADSNWQLGPWVAILNMGALGWSLATVGIGFLLGGFVLGILATWLVQAEINLYGEEGSA
jgi:hypothetical protein